MVASGTGSRARGNTVAREAAWQRPSLTIQSVLAMTASCKLELDVAYGPAQRWVVNIISLIEFARLRDKNFHTTVVDGIPIAVVSHGPNVNLRVELNGDALQVIEHVA